MDQKLAKKSFFSSRYRSRRLAEIKILEKKKSGGKQDQALLKLVASSPEKDTKRQKQRKQSKREEARKEWEKKKKEGEEEEEGEEGEREGEEEEEEG